MDLANGYTFVMYWMENPAWYRVNKDLDRFELTEAAPEEAAAETSSAESAVSAPAGAA